MKLKIRDNVISPVIDDEVEVWLELDSIGNVDVCSSKNGEPKRHEATFSPRGMKYFLIDSNFKEG